jgi:hypothetical protein
MPDLDNQFPKLVMLDWQDGDELLIRSKGYFCHNYVELEDGRRHQICFFDHVRISQELEVNLKIDKPYFIEEALIVLPEVTIENMQKALIEAKRIGFFERLKPLD